MAKGLVYGIFLFCRDTLGWDVYDFLDLLVYLIKGIIILGLIGFVIYIIMRPYIQSKIQEGQEKSKNNKKNFSDNVHIQDNTSPETRPSSGTKDIQKMYMETKAKIRKNQESTLSKGTVNSTEIGESSSNTKNIQKMYMEAKVKTNKDVETAIRDVSNVRNFCSNCGAKIEQSEKFCHSCGLELDSIR